LKAIADELERPVPAFAPRIMLRLTGSPVTTSERRAGEGTIEQVADDLEELRLLGAGTVVLDTFDIDPDETRHPEVAWHALAAVAARRNRMEQQ
jgi:hypothetical protein